MAMWPRVDLELVEDFYAESPWSSRWFLRIHTDIPLRDLDTVREIKAAMDRGKPNGDFSAVIGILQGTAPVSEDLARAGEKPEINRAWATVQAALTPPAEASPDTQQSRKA